MKVFQVINNRSRSSSIDIFRSIAIISVVIFHFNHKLPSGFLGVDLFFLISGFLVGGILIKDIELENKINFSKFFIQRGFKILPSYYFFVLFSNLIYVYVFDMPVISWHDLKSYLFFYQNYTGLCTHIWSLCVEEHFYVILPLAFIMIQGFIKKEYRLKTIFICIISTIILGILFKPISYFYTHSQDTYSATHNRIDALAWGVLLNLIITYFPDKIKSLRFKLITFSLGILIFIYTLYTYIKFNNILFEKLCLNSIVPISFFLILLSSYSIDFSKLRLLRIIAYYSYNWYLWHPVFSAYITDKIGNNYMGLLIYLTSTFLIAMISTIFIEEPFLKMRKIVVGKLFLKT